MAEYRRRLPHFHPDGEYLFVTWRLHGSLPVAQPGAGESRKFYELSAWVVMPNHVHLLILPLVALPKITHWIKGRTAREANLLLGRAGEPFWQHESYDHWARNERELQRIVAYIEDNPVSAGLAATPEDWPWSSTTTAS